MAKYFNSNDKSEKLERDNLSDFLEQLSFHVNSVGVWRNNKANLANYTINDVEFIFYKRGEGKTNIMGTEYYCKTNDLMVLEPMQLYTSVNDENIKTEYYFIHFDVDPVLQLKPFLKYFKYPVTTIENPERILTLFKLINEEVKDRKQGYVSNINALIKQMCIEVLRNQKNNTYDIHTTYYTQNISEMFVDKCISYISNNLKGDCSVKTLSKHFNVSNNYLYKSFMSVLNESPSKYVTRMRMWRAKSLLLTDLFTIEEISEEVGYPTLSHFSRVFKENVNCSPREFRKQNML